MEVALTRTLEVRICYGQSTLQVFHQLVVKSHRLPFQLLSQWWRLKPSVIVDPVSKSPEASLKKKCLCSVFILPSVPYCFMHFPVVSFRAPLLCSTFNVLNSNGIL